jgi:DNA-binding NarL/FixJ family response regulator
MNLAWVLPEEKAKGLVPIRAEEGFTPDAAMPSLRVLIVEDEAVISMELEAIVESQGYEVVDAVATAEAAIAAARRARPDLVLMDIRLARGGDGIAAALAIRRELGIRSIFLTAHSDPETRSRAAAAEPAGFIVKPLSAHQLVRAIRASYGT